MSELYLLTTCKHNGYGYKGLAKIKSILGESVGSIEFRIKSTVCFIICILCAENFLSIKFRMRTYVYMSFSTASVSHLPAYYYLKLCVFIYLKTTLKITHYINYYTTRGPGHNTVHWRDRASSALPVSSPSPGLLTG